MVTNFLNREKIRLLVVEDNPGDVRLLQEMLTKSLVTAIDIDSVGNLSQAIKRLKENKPDLILLDLGLPDGQGLETLDKMRAAAPDLPIIIMTGLSDETVGLQAVEQGAQDFIIKWQTSEAILVRAIRYAIERKKSEARQRERSALLNKLMTARKIDECLLYGCKAIQDSELFKCAAFIYYNDEGKIDHFGQIGLDKANITAIKRADIPDDLLWDKIKRTKYRISKSHFIPEESIGDLKIPFPSLASANKTGHNSSWKGGDLLIVPIRQSGSDKLNGLISVAHPYSAERPPTLDLIFRLEEIADVVSIRVLEIRHAEDLVHERQALAEKNIALREVLSTIEAEKLEIRTQIASMIDQVLKPTMSRLVRPDGTVNKTYFTSLKQNLDELAMTTGAATRLSSKLSPREMEICNMIKNGASTKDIAESLDIALVTVQKHREVIRKKLGLTNKDVNLTTHLRNM
jgi:DNA-binding NarL/FixJ family response regulator